MAARATAWTADRTARTAGTTGPTAEAAARAVVPQAALPTLTSSRAAYELGLRSTEFGLAVGLGYIGTTSAPGGGPPRIAQAEVDRLRGSEGFPRTLRERVRAVDTRTGAELISISPWRFGRLARTGHFTPVRFYLNRYRAVVWLYLADDVTRCAADHPGLLTGPTPPALRAMLDDGVDRRASAWRGRRLGMLLRTAKDPWLRAATVAAVLDPSTVAEVVADPAERSRLLLARPEFADFRPNSAAALAVVERLVRADRPDEIRWHRAHLARAVSRARQSGSASGPAKPAGFGAGSAATLLVRRAPLHGPVLSPHPHSHPDPAPCPAPRPVTGVGSRSDSRPDCPAHRPAGRPTGGGRSADRSVVRGRSGQKPDSSREGARLWAFHWLLVSRSSRSSRGGSRSRSARVWSRGRGRGGGAS